MSSFDISVAESHVRKAENDVEYYKRALDEAKRNGNYKNQRKSYRHSNGKVGNSYDCNYWSAQDELKKAKQHLKDVKERDRDERKAEKAKEKEAREKEKAERSSSKSTSSSSSSSYNSYRDDDDDDNYTSSYSSSSYSDDDDSDYSPTYSSYTPSYSSSPSWLVTLLLCLFFGGFGAGTPTVVWSSLSVPIKRPYPFSLILDPFLSLKVVKIVDISYVLLMCFFIKRKHSISIFLICIFICIHIYSI